MRQAQQQQQQQQHKTNGCGLAVCSDYNQTQGLYQVCTLSSCHMRVAAVAGGISHILLTAPLHACKEGQNFMTVSVMDGILRGCT